MPRLRHETIARTDGREIHGRNHLGRCPAEYIARCDGGGEGYDGNWKTFQGCDLAFFYRMPSNKRAADVTCPSCGLVLQITTRRLRAGFLALTDADVAAILASGGQPVDVSCLSPMTEPVIVDTAVTADVTLPAAPVPSEPVKNAKLVAAELALTAFDAKPRCAVCWAYNASSRQHPTCGFCRSWNQTEGDQTAQGERDQYTWKRGDLVERVRKAGGTPWPSPLGEAVVAHIEERNYRKAAERAKRVAELRARGIRVAG